MADSTGTQVERGKFKNSVAKTFRFLSREKRFGLLILYVASASQYIL